MLLKPFNQKAAEDLFAKAVAALCSCWDHLGDLEVELGLDVETDDIQEFAGDDDGSPEAFAALLETLKEREAEKCLLKPDLS